MDWFDFDKVKPSTIFAEEKYWLFGHNSEAAYLFKCVAAKEKEHGLDYRVLSYSSVTDEIDGLPFLLYNVKSFCDMMGYGDVTFSWCRIDNLTWQPIDTFQPDPKKIILFKYKTKHSGFMYHAAYETPFMPFEKAVKTASHAFDNYLDKSKQVWWCEIDE